jgi:hypothetical protein
MGARRTDIERRPPDGRGQRAALVLRRAVDLARVAARGVALLAVAAAASVVLAWIVWITERPPVDANDWAARGVVLAIALLPPGILGLFLAGLRELVELPRRVRDLPPELRAQFLEVRSRTAQPSGRVGLVGAVIRLGRLLLDARDVLSPYAVVGAVLRPALLLAAVVAAVVAVVEIPAALIAVLIVTVT